MTRGILRRRRRVRRLGAADLDAQIAELVEARIAAIIGRLTKINASIEARAIAAVANARRIDPNMGP